MEMFVESLKKKGSWGEVYAIKRKKRDLRGGPAQAMQRLREKGVRKNAKDEAAATVQDTRRETEQYEPVLFHLLVKTYVHGGKSQIVLRKPDQRF